MNTPSTQHWQISLSEVYQIVMDLEDISQCIRIICNTQKGTDPMRPNFGVDKMAYIDQPISTMVPGLIREMTSQIAMWEKRAEVLRITTAIDGSKITYVVHWTSSIGYYKTVINARSPYYY